ncbi:extra spindle pole bodies like 1, separase [Anticarsia gemmatalis]|uniref:extra spindle pole bodies like 1, separase n=1 Tax=Anticarsia gemmatalis TaxID=129554 RepID=UPI003F770FA1
MEDFDVFTNEINFTKPLFKNILNKYVNDVPSTPNGPNYQSGRKLMAEECLADSNDAACAFHLSEAASASLRTMAVYREEQLKAAGDKLHKITSYIKPVQNLVDSKPIPKKDSKLIDILSQGVANMTETLKKYAIDDELPFHKRYLRFTKENNVDNFQKILKELPKEWTIIQLTVPYNPNENLLPLKEYRTDVDSIYLSMFTNDYLEVCCAGPITVHVPGNIVKEGEKPLFTELYSLLDENYKTIDNAQFLNNKRLVQNYWNRREDIDLRMKSVINVMDKEWLGGWSCLLTGKLVDSNLRDKVIKLVDNTISDWGFIRLTQKQKILLYNLIECAPVLQSQQTKSCIRRILTEHGNTEDVRQVFNSECGNCTKEFRFLNELCLKCLSKCFEKIHNFSLVDGIRAFSQAVAQVKDGDEWSCLKKAKRHPVILIVDDMLDTFPWETLPVLNHHPVSRLENIHFLYYLYKIHEKDIKDGYFTTKCEVGRYVINPEKNLERMEARMTSFVKYWCGAWRGSVGEPPAPNDFVQYISDANVFLYCGHGDGCQLAAGGGAGVEAAGGRAVVLLAGCGSVRRNSAAPRSPPMAAHLHLHVAGCPTVVGMLWEVTDLEVDKVVSTLMSLCVPSDAPVPWTSVGKTKWSQGILDTSVEQKTPFVPERDVLRAICRARGSTNYIMIASSVVARGLPVRIVE